MPLSINEQLMYATLRIVCSNDAGESSVGSGFIFNFAADEKSSYYCVFTNKHVVENMDSLSLTFCLKDENGDPLDKQHHTFEVVNFQEGVIHHPDQSVDLCCIVISDLISMAKEIGKALMMISIDESVIPSQEQLLDLDTVEPISMIGYPNGLWDEINNKPLFRRGHTSTHPAMDYCGKKEFVIDCACYPGSSGSPIIISGSFWHMKNGDMSMKPRQYLMGILYAGPQYAVDGKVTQVDIPTAKVDVAYTRLMLNLGYVIKSERILEFKPFFGL